MDYAFIPGIGNKALEDLADFLSDQGDDFIHLWTEKATLSNFLSVVAHEATGPVNNLFIGADSNYGGSLMLALDENTESPATYEKIAASTSIQIPPPVKGPVTFVRLKFCSLGAPRYEAVLVALKKALGNPFFVTAPRYPHYIEKTSTGYWEYMAYHFVISGKEGGQPLSNRDDLIDKAVGSQFKFVDHTDIPREMWKTWIPENLKVGDRFYNESLACFFVSTPTVTSVRPVGQWIRGGRSPEPMPLLESNDAAPNEDDIVATRNTLRDLLGGRQDCQQSYAYPLFKRYGYDNLDDFVNSFKWAVTTAKGNTLKYALQFVGMRYRYIVHVPITKPGTNDLIFNYYPAPGPPPPGPPTINFTETNDPYDMFARV